MRVWLLLFAVLFGAFVTDARAEFVATVSSRGATGVGIQLRSPLETAPTHGTFPLTIEINNETGSSHTWTVSVKAGAWNAAGESKLSMTVPSGKSETYQLIVDLENQVGNNSAYVQIEVIGFGVMTAKHSVPNSTGAYNSAMTPYVLMTDGWRELYSRLRADWTGNATGAGGPGIADYPALSAHMTSSAKGIYLLGAQTSSENLPRDWRGYLGVDQLWLTEAEWAALNAPIRDAVRAWVLQGGCLVGLFQDERASLWRDFPLSGNNNEVRWGNYGLGSVYATAIAPLRLSSTEASQLMAKADVSTNALKSGETGSYTEVWGDIPTRRFAGAVAPIIVLTIIAYAIVVGPLNVFWWSSRNRALLYVTTPLISIAATLMLSLFIVLRDGTGGTGERAVAALLFGNERQLLVVQEQCSRNGLLFHNDFELPDTTVIRALNVDSPHRPYGYSADGSEFSKDGSSYYGDWFENRSTNAHLLQSLGPSRARVELLSSAPHAAPRVFSSVKENFRDFYYLDDSRSVWYASNLVAGKETTLDRSSESQLAQFTAEQMQHLGPAAREVVTGVNGRKNFFLASIERAEDLALPTLSSIRWTSTTGFMAGPMARKED